MPSISKVDALISFVENMSTGNISKLNKINMIIVKSFEDDKRNNEYSEKIYLSRDEKKLFLTKKNKSKCHNIHHYAQTP